MLSDMIYEFIFDKNIMLKKEVRAFLIGLFDIHISNLPVYLNIRVVVVWRVEIYDNTKPCYLGRSFWYFSRISVTDCLTSTISLPSMSGTWSLKHHQLNYLFSSLAKSQSPVDCPLRREPSGDWWQKGPNVKHFHIMTSSFVWLTGHKLAILVRFVEGVGHFPRSLYKDLRQTNSIPCAILLQTIIGFSYWSLATPARKTL